MKNYTEQELNDFSLEATKYFINKLKKQCSHFKVLTDEPIKGDFYRKIGFKVLIEGFVTSYEKSIIEIECCRDFAIFDSGSFINTFSINIKENRLLREEFSYTNNHLLFNMHYRDDCCSFGEEMDDTKKWIDCIMDNEKVFNPSKYMDIIEDVREGLVVSVRTSLEALNYLEPDYYPLIEYLKSYHLTERQKMKHIKNYIQAFEKLKKEIDVLKKEFLEKE
ncbi:hypothetical protein H2258_06470 [Campylobacter sp. RM9939]|uniref:hypothetical protein n=1 Tax=Campylobacter molothri TaxID=1032242 RepID=UPI00301D23F8|nr:hypothetical protein [Campylobacter sp. RM9939]